MGPPDRNRYRYRNRNRKEVTLGHDEPDLAWLRRLVGRSYQIQENQAVFGNSKNDFDPDSDFDLDKEQPCPGVTSDA